MFCVNFHCVKRTLSILWRIMFLSSPLEILIHKMMNFAAGSSFRSVVHSIMNNTLSNEENLNTCYWDKFLPKMKSVKMLIYFFGKSANFPITSRNTRYYVQGSYSCERRKAKRSPFYSHIRDLRWTDPSRPNLAPTHFNSYVSESSY